MNLLPFRSSPDMLFTNAPGCKPNFGLYSTKLLGISKSLDVIPPSSTLSRRETNGIALLLTLASSPPFTFPFPFFFIFSPLFFILCLVLGSNFFYDNKKNSHQEKNFHWIYGLLLLWIMFHDGLTVESHSQILYL